MCLIVVGCAGSSRGTQPVAPDREAEGQLWMQVAGDGEPTVVFEAGGGDDSSVWASVEREVRLKSGVRTVVYDRAGLGKSAPVAGPYKIEDEVAALDKALVRFGIKGKLILVAHAYGGFVAELMAAKDPRVVGVVLVDANLPAFFDSAEIAKAQAKLAGLEKSRPALASVLEPIRRAYPETVKRVAAAAYPAQLPTVDIVAEHSWGETEDENAKLRKAHVDFVGAAPDVREGVIATGSGHQVMQDRPEVVINAVARILQKIHATP